MNDDFDELDRAIFALPLEHSPAGLRESILRATIFREVPASAAFSIRETWGIGVALAVAAWLVILAVGDKSFGATATLYMSLFARELSEPATLAWLATGISIAILVVFSNFFEGLRPPVRNGRT
ncbi:MAG: hypothetical protein M3R53_10705 [Candidatus Eremiobacteraeota bacterium]|nr:hypothetical protein [Candidatus Eremiobacteraeota bacterium]